MQRRKPLNLAGSDLPETCIGKRPYYTAGRWQGGAQRLGKNSTNEGANQMQAGRVDVDSRQLKRHPCRSMEDLYRPDSGGAIPEETKPAVVFAISAPVRAKRSPCIPSPLHRAWRAGRSVHSAICLASPISASTSRAWLQTRCRRFATPIPDRTSSSTFFKVGPPSIPTTVEPSFLRACVQVSRPVPATGITW